MIVFQFYDTELELHEDDSKNSPEDAENGDSKSEECTVSAGRLSRSVFCGDGN